MGEAGAAVEGAAWHQPGSLILQRHPVSWKECGPPFMNWRLGYRQHRDPGKPFLLRPPVLESGVGGRSTDTAKAELAPSL